LKETVGQIQSLIAQHTKRKAYTKADAYSKPTRRQTTNEKSAVKQTALFGIYYILITKVACGNFRH